MKEKVTIVGQNIVTKGSSNEALWMELKNRKGMKTLLDYSARNQTVNWKSKNKYTRRMIVGKCLGCHSRGVYISQ